MINRDPLGELCEDTINMLTLIAFLATLGLAILYLEVKGLFIRPYYSLRIAYCTVYHALRVVWISLYWKHLYTPLYLCGFVPALTDDDVVRLSERRHNGSVDSETKK